MIALAVGGVVISLVLLLAPERPLEVELIAATDHSPPFQIVLPDGTITGATVEAMNLAAARAGITLHWMVSSMRPDDVLADIDSGVDLWPLVTVFPDRKDRFYTTQPFGRAEYIIAVIDDDRFSGDKAKLKHYQPRRVAVSRGPWIQSKLDADLPSSEPVFVNSGQQLLALCDGRADALIADAASLYSMTLQMPASCAGKQILDRLMEGWYWDLAIGSSFARSAEADRIRAEFGHLAREGELHEVFADYPIQAQYRSQDTFAETRTERESRITRAMLVSLCVCSLALFGIVLETRRRASQAMRLVRLKSNLVDRISHELRTPLNGVLGLASLLAATPLNAIQKDYLGLIRQSGDQLLKLVNDSLMLSRLEAGHQRRSQEVVNVRQHLEDIASLLAPMAHDRDIDLVWEVSPEVPASIIADAGVIRQLLINLCGNAMKYTEQGVVSLGVGVSGLASGCPFLRYQVDDSGPGIPAEDRARIFDSFVRLDRPADHRAIGTGLGLAIFKELVVLLGGRLGVENGKFGGARFWFEFPVELPEARSVTEGAENKAEELSRTVSASSVAPDTAGEPGIAEGVACLPDEDTSNECGSLIALLLKFQGTESQSPAADLKKLAAAIKPLPAGRVPVGGEGAAEADIRIRTGVASLRDRMALALPGRAAAPVETLPSETLQMVAQHLEMQGYTCFSETISNAEASPILAGGLAPRVLVLEYPAGETNLRALISDLRARYRDPSIPTIVFCRNAARATPCETKRPSGVRVMRVPFLSRSFDRVLKDAREELRDWRGESNDDANPAEALVECDQDDCPMRTAGHVVGGTSVLREQLPASNCQRCDSATPPTECHQGNGIEHSRVLVADDNPVNRLVLSAMLRGMGAQCDEVVDGQDALLACEKTRYDLLFLDHHMPHKDGIAVTEDLRKQSDWRSVVPIIAASAADTELQRARYRATAVNAVLAKPFTKQDLIAALEAVGWSGHKEAEAQPESTETTADPSPRTLKSATADKRKEKTSVRTS